MAQREQQNVLEALTTKPFKDIRERLNSMRMSATTIVDTLKTAELVPGSIEQQKKQLDDFNLALAYADEIEAIKFMRLLQLMREVKRKELYDFLERTEQEYIDLQQAIQSSAHQFIALPDNYYQNFILELSKIIKIYDALIKHLQDKINRIDANIENTKHSITSLKNNILLLETQLREAINKYILSNISNSACKIIVDSKYISGSTKAMKHEYLANLDASIVANAVIKSIQTGSYLADSSMIDSVIDDLQREHRVLIDKTAISKDEDFLKSLSEGIDGIKKNLPSSIHELSRKYNLKSVQLNETQHELTKLTIKKQEASSELSRATEIRDNLSALSKQLQDYKTNPAPAVSAASDQTLQAAREQLNQHTSPTVAVDPTVDGGDIKNSRKR